MLWRTLIVVSWALVACGGKTAGDATSPSDSHSDAGTGAGTVFPPAGSSADAGSVSNTPTPVPSAPSTAPDAAAPPAACIAANRLDRDSFDVAAFALATCLKVPSTANCRRIHDATEDSLTLTELDEGVGTLRFDYANASVTGGPHTLLGTQLGQNGQSDVIMKASGIANTFTLEDSLTTLYVAASDVTTATPLFDCTYQ